MKIQEYITSATRPSVYTPGSAAMWSDEHISRQLLEVHLNPDIDLASRKPETIDATIDWILSHFRTASLNILDMGCGPGLYAERLAQLGHRVTGIDISANSICYARENALKNGLNIHYINRNYLDLDERNQYDLILMIFTDFGVLVPEERKKVLENIHRALKPGGRFIFDVLNEQYPLAEALPNQWEMANTGFWKSTPYLALQEHLYYPEEHVRLSQHIIVDGDGDIETYRFWTHAFSPGQLKAIVEEVGFHRISVVDDILPDSSFYRAKDISFCIAQKSRTA